MDLDRSAFGSVWRLWAADERTDSKQRHRPIHIKSEQGAVSTVRVTSLLWGPHRDRLSHYVL